MKHYIVFLLSIALFVQSCKYDDYIMNEHEFTTVSFAVQKPIRTIIPGVDEDIEIGVVIGGMRTTEQDQWADYKIDGTLLEDYPELKLMPESYYTVSDPNRMEIPKGEIAGGVTFTFDMNAFLENEEAHDITYAIPLVIDASSLDQTIEGKEYTIVVVKYINNYHGAYAHKGTTTVSVDGMVEESVVYSEPDLLLNQTAILSTQSKNQITTDKASIFENDGIMVQVNDDNTITLSDKEGSGITGVLAGEGNVYNPEKKEFYLNYSFSKGGKDYSVKDTLIFKSYDLSFETWD